MKFSVVLKSGLRVLDSERVASTRALKRPLSHSVPEPQEVAFGQACADIARKTQVRPVGNIRLQRPGQRRLDASEIIAAKRTEVDRFERVGTLVRWTLLTPEP